MRSQFRLGWAFILVGAMLFAISLQAQTPIVKEAIPTGAQEYRAKRILGTGVQIEGNIAIGTVDDIVFRDDGVVEYLVVLNEGKLISVPWEAAKFNFEKKIASVSITREQYKLIPTFTVETYPRFFTPEYQIQTYKYYGLTPAQERRLERKLDRKEKR
jgi:hypothetical protein